ncbi:hypothetical protein CDD82_4238 [Ophiocordyceps australis]|uniref:Asl1-like glycosyl hydrolase catalytic domain-containing protein n=1 Tax=Ophiocordyceps australis TaxID=1399860 RepID=A0A2C5Z8Z0_9HYPO|nr:hypothetical protein CDD82_4238 [Ophiocordyceps australis]
MYPKSLATMAVVATLSQQSLAFNSHRHLHRQEAKRDVAMDMVTVWETVYVTESADPGPQQTTVTAFTTTTMDSMPQQSSPSEAVAPVEQPPAAAPAPPAQEAPAAPPAQDAPPAPPAEKPPVAPPAEQPPAATPVKQAPPAPPVEQPPPSSAVQEPPPPPPQTTLATAVKPAPPASAPQISSPAPPVSAIKVQPQSSSQPPAAKPSGSNKMPSSGPGFVGKRGLAYNDGSLANTFGSSCQQCGWAYNWASSPQGLDPKISFVPMLWGDSPTHTGHWDSDAEKALASGTKALFSFNEPDIKGQANLSPQQAAASHVKYMNKYAGRALIGAPSVSNSNLEGEGLAWLKSFMSACENQQEKCQVDFCNVHWYAPASAADTLFDHLEQAHQACGGKPVWLTEFAPVGDPSQTSGFLQTVMPKLEKLDYVDAYSYFMVSSGNLMSSATDLSSFGKVYASMA